MSTQESSRLKRTIQTLGTYAEMMLGLRMGAFSFEVRRKIGERDGWTCGCGRSFHDGWMVEASHYNHDRGNPDYDTANEGRILCRKCHLKDHIYLLKSDSTGDNLMALRLQVTTAWKKGLHTYKAYEETPRILAYDHEEIRELMVFHELDLEMLMLGEIPEDGLYQQTLPGLDM